MRVLLPGMSLVCLSCWPGRWTRQSQARVNNQPSQDCIVLLVSLGGSQALLVNNSLFVTVAVRLPRRPRSAFNYGIGSRLDNALYPWRMNSRNDDAWRCSGDGVGFGGNDSGGAGDNGEGLRG